MYVVKPEDRMYAAELRDNPFGRHSPGLQRLLNLLRADRSAPRLVLLAVKPHEEWVIARLPQARSTPVQIEGDRIFTSLADAEWAIFCRRWEAYTGETLN